MITEPTANDYRMTELGPLPPEWRVVRLGEVADIKYGRAKPKSQGTIPVIGSGGIYDWTSISLIQSSTLVIGRKGTAGQVWLTEQPVWPADTTFYLQWNEEKLVEPFFLFAFLRLFPLSGEHARTTLPSLQRNYLENYPIPLPPLAEQRAIAHTLRAAQQAKLSSERMVAALRTVKQSLMHHLFRYGPVPLAECDRVPLRETPLGPLPAHWQVVRLGEVVEETQQVNPRQQQDQTFKYIDVSCVDNTSLMITNYQVLSTKEAPSRARKLVRTDDVIFATIRPYLKRIAQIPLELNNQICSTAFCVLRPNKNLINKDFLFFAVTREPFIAAVTEHQRGSSYPAVTDSDVLRESIPLPPLAEQQRIAAILQAVDRRIAAAESRVRALADLFATLLRDLMTARRRIPPEVVAQFAG